MEGILRFSLPEEREEFNDASNVVNYKLALRDIENYLRMLYKTDLNKSTDEIREKFYEILSDNKVSL